MQIFSSNLIPILRLDNYFYEQRKYKVLEVLNSLPADISKQTKKELPNLLEINRQTFANWLNASITDKSEIPSLKLAIIAKVLKVPIEELFNIQIPTISIEPPNKQFKNAVLTKTGLTI